MVISKQTEGQLRPSLVTVYLLPHRECMYSGCGVTFYSTSGTLHMVHKACIIVSDIFQSVVVSTLRTQSNEVNLNTAVCS